MKCRYCNEFLDESMRPAVARKDEELPFYFRTSFIVLLFLIFPILALPSIWLHPKLNLVLKVVLTVVAVAICWASYIALQGLMGQLDAATGVLDDLGY